MELLELRSSGSYSTFPSTKLYEFFAPSSCTNVHFTSYCNHCNDNWYMLNFFFREIKINRSYNYFFFLLFLCVKLKLLLQGNCEARTITNLKLHFSTAKISVKLTTRFVKRQSANGKLHITRNIKNIFVGQCLRRNLLKMSLFYLS